VYPVGATAAIIEGIGTLQVNQDGSFTFTPALNYSGPVPQVTYTISDVKGGLSSSTLDITITPVNDAPMATDDTGVVKANTPLSGNVILNDSDPEGSPITVTQFTVAGLVGTFTAGQTATIPNVGTLVINANGTFTFTPVLNYAGPVPVATYTISDGSATDTATLTLNINNPLVAVNDTGVVIEDTPLKGTVILNDSDADGDPIEVTQFTVDGLSETFIAGQTATIPLVGTLVINTDGSFTFTPFSNYTGPIPVVTYGISDGTDTDTATLTLTITPVNYPPVAKDDVDFVTEDTPLNGTVFTNDSDLDGNNTISISEFKVAGVTGTFTAGQTATIPNVGTLVINTDGSFTFTPVANYTGPIPVVTYTISDGTSTDTATLTLTITPVNDNPVAVADTKTTPEDTPVSGTVLTNDSDVDGDSLAVTQFTVNGQTYLAGSTATINGVGTLNINADGTYTFTPEKDYDGPVPVATYEVSDGNGGTATATLTITIIPVKDIEANIDNFQNNEVNGLTGGSAGNVLTNDKVDGKPVNASELVITVKDDGGMKGVTIDALGNLNVPKGTPPGTYIIQYTICDVLVPTNCDDAIAIVEVFHGVDLAINKRAEETKLWEGDEFTYILTVGNVGGTDASEVVVIDNLPAGLTFKSAQLVGTSGLQLSTVVEGQKVTMKLPTLKAGQVVEIKLNVKARPLSGSNTETILNTASVASKETELKTTDNTSSTAVQIQPFFIPNVITPNGDRKNDEFVIKGLGKFNSNEIVIFNRYGDHVFQKKGYENDWSGKGLVAGTYFYILSVVDINGNPTEFKGWIQLIRE
jgi:gliding motility-associated-like protein